MVIGSFGINLYRYMLDFSGRTDTLYNSKLHDIIQKEVFTNDAEPDTKNHMDIPWHQFTGSDKSLPITQTGLTEKASVIGRTGLMMLSCGTGAWRVRSSMNSLATLLGVTCTADIGLMSIEYTCFDGTDCYSQSLCLTNTGVNTSKLNRLERFVNDFDHECCTMSGEQIHTYLDQIEQIHGLYSPFALGCASALACSAFTFLLGGGPIEMLCAFFGAGIGNYLRCKLTKHHLHCFSALQHPSQVPVWFMPDC